MLQCESGGGHSAAASPSEYRVPTSGYSTLTGWAGPTAWGDYSIAENLPSTHSPPSGSSDASRTPTNKTINSSGLSLPSPYLGAWDHTPPQNVLPLYLADAQQAQHTQNPFDARASATAMQWPSLDDGHDMTLNPFEMGPWDARRPN